MEHEIFNFVTKRTRLTASGQPALVLSGGFMLMCTISDEIRPSLY